MLYFISDTHFGHSDIIRLSNRPFKNIEDHDTAIINNINRMVKEDDTLIVLGDFCLGNARLVKDYRSKINCKKVILVKGNHDHQGFNAFDLVVNMLWLKIANQDVLMCHKPYRKQWWRWYRTPDNATRPIDRGMFLLHGHTHGTYKNRGRMLNLCVDAWQFKPVTLQQIEALINQHIEFMKKNSLRFKIKRFLKKYLTFK